MARVVSIGRSIGAGGKLAGKCLVAFIRLKSSAKAAVRSFEASLVSEGVPWDAAKELAASYPSVKDLGLGDLRSGEEK